MKSAIVGAALLATSQSTLAVNISDDVLENINKIGIRAYVACTESGKTVNQCARILNEITMRLREETDTYCSTSFVYETEQKCIDNEIEKRIRKSFEEIMDKSTEAIKIVI